MPCPEATPLNAMIFWLGLSLSLVLALSSLARVDASSTTITPVDVLLGQEQGLVAGASINTENLQKILDGVSKGNRENIYYYGLLKLYGIGVSKDVQTAADQFLRARLLGHQEATTAYGVMRLTGDDGKKPDFSVAGKCFREAVAMGDVNAHWLLGKMLLEGKGVPQPAYVEAAALLRKASDANEPRAHHLLGVLYEYGLGVATNYELAGKYYHRAAEQHYVESVYHLALMYAYGRGYQQDFQRARSLLDAAARSNHGPSMYFIGVFKTYGYGTTINYEQAVNWFERAAGSGDSRFADEASKNAQELKTKVIVARDHVEQVLDQFQAQADRYD